MNYTYTRTTNLLGNATFSVTPRVGVVAGRLRARPDADRHAARRQQLQRADLHPEPGEGHRRRQRLPADQLGRLLHRLPRPRVQRREAALEPVDGARRLRASTTPASTTQPQATLRHQRQPDADDHRAARRRRPVRAARAAATRPGSVFINAKWQFNANAMYRAPYRHRDRRQRVRPAGVSVPAVPTQARSAPTPGFRSS